MWKVNELKVQGKVVNKRPTFDQLLNKYKKAVPKNRPLKKKLRSPLHQGKPASLRGEFNKRRGDVTTLFPPQKVYPTMPWHRRHQILLAQRGSTKGFGYNDIRCRIHYLTRGEETSEDLCLTGYHNWCMTNWALTNLV